MKADDLLCSRNAWEEKGRNSYLNSCLGRYADRVEQLPMLSWASIRLATSFLTKS